MRVLYQMVRGLSRGIREKSEARNPRAANDLRWRSCGSWQGNRAYQARVRCSPRRHRGRASTTVHAHRLRWRRGGWRGGWACESFSSCVYYTIPRGRVKGLGGFFCDPKSLSPKGLGPLRGRRGRLHVKELPQKTQGFDVFPEFGHEARQAIYEPLL